MDYHKFRGRGPGATENRLGADGLFELTLRTSEKIEKKSLLFQSKINWMDDRKLLNEAIKLTNWREAAFVLNFTATEFEAIALDIVISCKGKRNDNMEVTPLDVFIGSEFLNGIVGDVDLKYDAVSRRLIWKAMTGEIVSTKFSIPQRIAIQMQAPGVNYGGFMKYDKSIDNEEIHNYRMNVSDEEILSLGVTYSATELKNARAKKALVYHSDILNLDDILCNKLMKSRMQEVNAAHDSLKVKIKK